MLDFCSAATGVAALELGRRYIGIELHQPYNDVAPCRLGLPTPFLSPPGRSCPCGPAAIEDECRVRL